MINRKHNRTYKKTSAQMPRRNLFLGGLWENFTGILLVFLLFSAFQYTINIDQVLKSPPSYDPDTPIASIGMIYLARPNYDTSQIEYKVHDLVNKERECIGVQPLEYSTTLAQSSREYSKVMALSNKFEHATNIPWGENIAASTDLIWGYGCFGRWKSEDQIAEQLYNIWRTSPGHYVNFISPIYRSEGIGVYFEGGGFDATQRFQPI